MAFDVHIWSAYEIMFLKIFAFFLYAAFSGSSTRLFEKRRREAPERLPASGGNGEARRRRAEPNANHFEK